jgi:hypothetical protein
MALTPPGSPYVESSDLVANYPAVSESLAERVDLVGVLPFATSTARGTAIPSPTDGQYSYLQDTNTTQFWNGSAWQTAGSTPGLTLITPTSIANSGGSSSASGGQVTFTAVNSISLNGVFSASYDAYKIVIRFTGSAAGAGISYRNRLAGTDAITNYNTQYLDASGTSITGSRGSGTLASVGSFRSTGQAESWIEVYGPALAAETGIFSSCRERNLNISFSIFGDNHTTATAYDGMTILPTTGTITGTVRVYSYQNS